MDPIRSIVVATDFSALSKAAATRAVALARPDGAAIHLVHAVAMPVVVAPSHLAPMPEAVWQNIRAARKSARERLEEVQKAIESQGIQRVTSEISDSGDAVKAIEAAAEAHGADLIVMGTHGHGGIKHAFLGSVAERTLRTIDRPVLAVKEDPAKAEEPITRILLAVDFSAHSDRAVEIAAGLAKRFGATVDALHAFELPGEYIPFASPFGVELARKVQVSAGEMLESACERLQDDQLSLRLHVRRGRPSLVIAELAEETGCQLIVMGTRGNSGLTHVLLGSVAERTLRIAPCSVLIVHAEPSRDRD